MWLQEPRGGFMSSDVAAEAKMQLQEQKLATGANMQLQEPIHDHRSQDVTAGAMMWLQEQDVDAGVKMWLQENLSTKVACIFVALLVFFRFT